MKTLKNNILNALRMFREELVRDTPVQYDTMHTLSLAGAYNLQQQMYAKDKIEKYSTGQNVSLAANATTTITFNIPSKTGKVWFLSSAYSDTYICGVFNLGTTSVTIQVRNPTTSSQISMVYIQVLYWPQ